MELNNVKNWSYDELDNAIIFSKKEIARLESEIKLLREVKSQKTMTDSLAMITDFGIDFSLADLQAFLSSRRNVVTKIANKTPEEISKKPTETKIPAPEISSDTQVAKISTSEEEVEKKNETVPDNSPDEVLNNPPAVEIFEEVKSDEGKKSLRVIARSLGLPEDSTFEQIKKAFKAGGRNNLPPAYADHFEDLLGKMERGEIE